VGCAGCDILDAPRFEWQGVMFDVSRFFLDVHAVNALLDGTAMLKLNVFHWHLTDDPGWRIKIKKYPNFAGRGGTGRARRMHWPPSDLDNVTYGPFLYTREEVKVVVKYAKVWGITVAPEIEMSGHSLAALAAYPDMSCNGTGPFEPLSQFGGFFEVHCAGNDRTLEILRDVLDDIMELSDSEYIHTGGDECSKYQKRAKDEDLKDLDELQAWFT